MRWVIRSGVRSPCSAPICAATSASHQLSGHPRHALTHHVGVFSVQQLVGNLGSSHPGQLGHRGVSFVALREQTDDSQTRGGRDASQPASPPTPLSPTSPVRLTATVPLPQGRAPPRARPVTLAQRAIRLLPSHHDTRAPNRTSRGGGPGHDHLQSRARVLDGDTMWCIRARRDGTGRCPPCCVCLLGAALTGEGAAGGGPLGVTERWRSPPSS